MRRSSLSMGCGRLSISILRRLAASSMRSMALSGDSCSHDVHRVPAFPASFIAAFPASKPYKLRPFLHKSRTLITTFGHRLAIYPAVINTRDSKIWLYHPLYAIHSPHKNGLVTLAPKIIGSTSQDLLVLNLGQSRIASLRWKPGSIYNIFNIIKIFLMKLR